MARVSGCPVGNAALLIEMNVIFIIIKLTNNYKSPLPEEFDDYLF